MNTTNTQEVVEALQMLSGKTDASYSPNPLRKPTMPVFGEIPGVPAQLVDIPAAHTPISTQPAPAAATIPSHIKQTLESAEEKRTGISILVGLTYKSLSGNNKERDFLIRRVIHSGNEIFFEGLAMDIRAPRLVKVSNISQIRDIATGKLYPNPYQFIQTRLGVYVPDDILPEQLPAFAAVIKRMHNEIAVLMYVVALDGIREKVERMAVLKYVKEQTTDLTYSDEELNDYLISVAPDAESAGMAFQRILAKDKKSIQTFVEALITVIMANGGANPKERVFLAKVMELLEQQGFQLNLSV